MRDQLAGEEVLNAGVYQYIITKAGGTETPPEYRVTVTRREGDNEPEEVGHIHFTGVLMHEFAENSAFLDAVVREIRALIQTT
jgi:hypothetical protein